MYVGIQIYMQVEPLSSPELEGPLYVAASGWLFCFLARGLSAVGCSRSESAGGWSVADYPEREKQAQRLYGWKEAALNFCLVT